MKVDKFKEKLFTQFKHQLGAPVRKVELTDEQMDTLLDVVVEDYAQYIQEYFMRQSGNPLHDDNVNAYHLNKFFNYTVEGNTQAPPVYDPTHMNIPPAKGRNNLTSIVKSINVCDIQIEDLNNISLTIIRRLFVAECKITLGRVRGKFTGKVSISDDEKDDRTLDYESLLKEGIDERTAIRTDMLRIINHA